MVKLTMNILGIIVAETEEYDVVLNIMMTEEIREIYDLKFTIGKINNIDTILVKSGVGKVNAARTTQILIDNFNVDYIFNIGSAGGLNDALSIGNVIIATKLAQYDFDVTAFGREKGMIPSVGRFFYSDNDLINEIMDLNLNEIVLNRGIIVSGDSFIKDIKLKNKIKDEFNADCVEMEGAAVAQTCFMANKPFVIIRSISDIPNGSNNIDFNEFLKIASKNCAEIIDKLTQKLKKEST